MAIEEKLNMIDFACIRYIDKAHIVKLLDNSQAVVQSLEGMPNDKTNVRAWLHMYSYRPPLDPTGGRNLERVV